MCLVLLAWKVHPRYPLIVAANRDEYFERPTRSAEFWADCPSILAGRDLSAGGTWMGMTRSGRFAALTNHRDPARQRPDARSRGMLVADFLSGESTPADYMEALTGKAPAIYNGFNLLAGDRDSMFWYSNVCDTPIQLTPEIYGLSNDLLDTPWPKVERSKSALAAALRQLPDDRALFDLLRDDAVYPDELLPRTGVDPAWERLLSAAFIRGPGYGTRSSTVLTQDTRGSVLFDEQTWLENGSAGARRRFRFGMG